MSWFLTGLLFAASPAASPMPSPAAPDTKPAVTRESPEAFLTPLLGKDGHWSTFADETFSKAK